MDAVRAWRRRLLYLCAILAPLALLASPSAVFSFDWNNNLWLIGYFGEYLRHHACAPLILNSAAGVGNALPAFYGYLLFPLLGSLSALLGAGLALRLGALAVTGFAFAAAMAAGRRAFAHRGLSFTLAASLIWSTYSLTNFYNRSAIPEYFATSMFAACAALAFCTAAEADRKKARAFWLWTVLAAALTVGFHPPTAVMAGACFALVGGAALLSLCLCGLSRRRPRIFRLAGGILAWGVIILPWVYATHRLAHALSFGFTGRPLPLMFLLDRSDSVAARFAPFPFDALSNGKGVVDVSTPYLETQVSMAVLALVVFNLFSLLRDGWSGAKRALLAVKRPQLWIGFAAGSLALFALLASISVQPALADFGPLAYLGPVLQFSYRLAGHCNVALLAAALLTGFSARNAIDPRHAALVSALLIGWSGQSLAVKLTHAAAIRQNESVPAFAVEGNRDWIVNTGNDWLDGNYATAGLYPAIGPDAAKSMPRFSFPVAASGEHFGEVGALAFNSNVPIWIQTNLIVFPWNRVLWNGHRLDRSQLRVNGHLLAVRVPAGKGTLSWEFHPDPYWAWMRRLSFTALAAVSAAAALFSVGAWRPRTTAVVANRGGGKPGAAAAIYNI